MGHLPAGSERGAADGYHGNPQVTSTDRAEAGMTERRDWTRRATVEFEGWPFQHVVMCEGYFGCAKPARCAGRAVPKIGVMRPRRHEGAKPRSTE